MFEGIEEGLAIYREELAKYKKWSDKMKKLYGENPMATWPDNEYKKCGEWSEKLNGMSAVLGLTKEEVRQEETAAGFVFPEN